MFNFVRFTHYFFYSTIGDALKFCRKYTIKKILTKINLSKIKNFFDIFANTLTIFDFTLFSVENIEIRFNFIASQLLRIDIQCAGLRLLLLHALQ